MMGTDLYSGQRKGWEVKLPRDPSGFVFDLPEVGGLELIDAHQDSTGGSQMQVGLIASHQASLELNTAGDGSCIFQRQPECFYFLQAELLETGCGNREICPDPPDYMTPNAFCQ